MEESLIGKKIVIINPTFSGRQFLNLKIGTIHEIVEPPKGYINGQGGVWVMGVGEPVKVLNREYDFVK